MGAEYSVPSRRATRGRRRWRTTVVKLLLLSLLVVGISIWRYGIPLAERAIGTLGGLFAAFAAGAGNAMNDGIDEVYLILRDDVWVRERLGGPIAFPPFDEIQWSQPVENGELPFSFAIYGSRAAGEVRGRLRIEQDRSKVVGLTVSDSTQSHLILPIFR
ncbi:MAG: hypothetical protein KF708_01670 [Pirellulales bacterium]|nr:hypothetical protein [Pirellulales bacterium]